MRRIRGVRDLGVPVVMFAVAVVTLSALVYSQVRLVHAQVKDGASVAKDDAHRVFTDRLVAAGHKQKALQAAYVGKQVRWSGTAIECGDADLMLVANGHKSPTRSFVISSKKPAELAKFEALRENTRVVVEGRISSVSILGAIVVDARIVEQGPAK